jgi:SpoVK/Ycf46/Vps4 family AAA+-type ATPase
MQGSNLGRRTCAAKLYQKYAFSTFEGSYTREADWLDSFVMVVAATNTPWALDPAAIDRFSRRIFVQLPSFEERRLYFVEYLTNNAVSTLTEGQAE